MEDSAWQEARRPRGATSLCRPRSTKSGAAGSLDVTVGRIAKRAGVSPALAFHYFGGKERLFLAAMRAILTLYGAESRRELAAARGPPRPAFGACPGQFLRAEFPARSCCRLAQLLRGGADPSRRPRAFCGVYQNRLVSNLTHALRPLSPDPVAVARTAAALIDGLYIRHALAEAGPPDAAAAIATVEAYFDGVLR